MVTGLCYPVTPPAASGACGETVVGLAEGTVSVGGMIDRSNADEFTSSEDLEEEFRACSRGTRSGGPFQSDGDV